MSIKKDSYTNSKIVRQEKKNTADLLGVRCSI